MGKSLLKRFPSQSLSLRLYIIIIPTTLLAIGCYGFLNVRVISHLLESQVETSTQDIALRLATDISDDVIPTDPSKLHAWLEELLETNSFIRRIEIFRKTEKQLERIATTSAGVAPAIIVDETVTVREGRAQRLVQYREKERLLKIIVPVRNPLGTTGCVSVSSSLNQSDLFVKAHNRIALFLIPAVVLMLVLMLHYSFTRVMTRRIARIGHAMMQTRTGNLEVRAPVDHRDELGMIAGRFNEAMDEIARASSERDRLLDEQRHFSARLQEKVDEATHELNVTNTQLRQANQDLIQAQRLATQHERMAVAGRLAATFAHEIGSPLSAMSTHLQLLAEDAECSSNSKRRIGMIQQQVDRITSFVEELLSETRAAARTEKALQLNDLVLHVLRFLEEHLAKLHVDVELNLAQELPEVYADAQQIQQVLLNLLNNACDAMPRGGTIRIATSTARESEGSVSALVSVSDSGTGIPAEKQQHIFEPFFTTKDLKRGTGLGLNIAARIVKAHGGSIDFTSSAGAGATFRVSLPAIAPHTDGAVAAKSERQVT